MELPELHTFDNNGATVLDAGAPVAAARPLLQLEWRQVSYAVSTWTPTVPPIRRLKTILQNVSGCLTAGSMTALMGPSGCGKTTLLNCIAGKVTDSGLSGHISLKSVSNLSDLRIGFVPQHGHLFLMFSVHESVLFASRIKNPAFSDEEHKQTVLHVLQSLDIDTVGEKKLSKLSGGQLKRVSIALELVPDPEILMLDEPTTGLDSMSSETVIQLLKQLSNKGTQAPAIVATIHQPSSDVFKLFDQIYLMSKDGRNLYTGSPGNVMDHLEMFGFPKKETSPAEYAIEVANEKHGDEQFDGMARLAEERFSSFFPVHEESGGVAIQDKIQSPKSSWVRQFVLTLRRQWSAQSRVLMLRIAMMAVMAICVCCVPGKPFGQYTGCASGALGAADGMKDSRQLHLIKQVIFGQEGKEGAFDTRTQANGMQQIIMFITVSLFYQMMCSASISLTVFANELPIVKRETSNRWYNTSSLFVAVTVNETIGICLSCFVFVTISFYAADLPTDDLTRFWLVFGACFLIGHVFGGRGLLFATVFSSNPTIAMVTTFASILTSGFLGGVLVRIPVMTPIARPFTVMSEGKQSFDVVMIALFGFERCSPGGSDIASYVTEEVLPHKSLLRIAKALWPVLNVTQGDLRAVAERVNLTSSYFDDLPDALDQQLGPRENAADFLDEEESKASYILSLFELEEATVGTSFALLIVLAVVTRLLFLLALTYKFKDRRL